MFHGNNLIETTHLLNIPNWQCKASTSTFCLLPVRHIHLIPLVLQQTKNKPSSTDSRRANHITNGLFLSFSYILILSEKAMTLPINLAMLQELNGPYKLTRVKGQKPTYHNIAKCIMGGRVLKNCNKDQKTTPSQMEDNLDSCHPSPNQNQKMKFSIMRNPLIQMNTTLLIPPETSTTSMNELNSRKSQMPTSFPYVHEHLT